MVAPLAATMCQYQETVANLDCTDTCGSANNFAMYLCYDIAHIRKGTAFDSLVQQ